MIIHNIHRLQFNILDHTLVPNMRILNTTEEEEFRKWDGIEEDWEDFNKKEEKK